jgi:hypothetical protein
VLAPSLPQEQQLLAFKALLKGMKDKKGDVRAASASALGALVPSLPQEQQHLAFQALLTGMKDKDSDVRAGSAWALVALGPSLPQEQQLQAFQALLNGMKDENVFGNVRQASASALGALGPSLPKEQQLQAFRALLTGMKDTDNDIGEASAEGLSLILKNLLPINWLQTQLPKLNKLLKTLPMPIQTILPSENPPRSEEIANEESSEANESFDVEVEQPTKGNQQSPIWYSDHELEQLLHLQLPLEIEDSKGSVHLWSRATTSQELESQLKYAMPAISIEKLSISIIPIFLNAKENNFHREGNHWGVLILVNVPQKNNKEPRRLAIYQNPLGLKIPDSVDQFLKGWELSDLRCKQQTNDNDCGPWVVYSVVNLVEKLQECQNLTLSDFQECIRPVAQEQGDQLRDFYQKMLVEKRKPENPKLINKSSHIKLDDKGKEEKSPRSNTIYQN